MTAGCAGGAAESTLTLFCGYLRLPRCALEDLPITPRIPLQFLENCWKMTPIFPLFFITLRYLHFEWYRKRYKFSFIMRNRLRYC